MIKFKKRNIVFVGLIFFFFIHVMASEIHEAVLKGDLEMLKKLIGLKKDSVNAKDKWGSTPLHIAVKETRKDMIETLISKGANVNAIDNNGRTPLHHAVEMGNEEISKLLLDKGANSNAKNLWGFTSLHSAALGGNKNLFELLISKGADINIKNVDFSLPLHYAAMTNRKDITQLLVTKGSDVTARDIFGETPLDWAAISGHYITSMILADSAKQRNSYETLNKCPMQRAAYAGFKNILEYLLSSGASLNALDDDGQNSLHWAVLGGKKNIAEFLLDKGLNINDRSKSGRTPLHLAAITGNNDMIEFLLVRGANIDAQDIEGKTPLQLSIEYSRKHSAQLLSEKGAKTNSAIENFEKSPLLNKEIKENEALIFYLGHCGWAVKTKNHFLIFDYTTQAPPPQNASLFNGYLNPFEIKDLNVTVFVTHQHADHYDRIIFEGEKYIKNITYVFGWKALDNRKYYYLDNPKEVKIINGIEISTINSHHDDVPEVAYLVKVDGLVIYHSGDYVGTLDSYKKDIDYLDAKYKKVDIAFLFLCGDTSIYTMEKLVPEAMFPMHFGGREFLYKGISRFYASKNSKSKVLCAENRGDRFFYQNGETKKQ